MNRLRGILFIAYYWLFAQFYVLWILIPGLLKSRTEKTPYTRRYHQGFMKYIFKSKFYYCDNTMRDHIRQQQKCVIFSNHRSWVDFTACLLSTAPERVGFVSRMSAAYLFPLAFLICKLLEKSLVVFNRDSKKRISLRRKLFASMKKVVEKEIFLTVFPEGHRYTGDGTLELKHGVIHFAYRNQYPCAVVLHYGNEKIYNEKEHHINTKQTVYVLHEGLYEPKDFNTENDFYNAINQAFIDGWQRLKNDVNNLKGGHHEN